MTLPATDRMREAAASLDGRVDRLRGEDRRKAELAAAERLAAQLATFPCRSKPGAILVLRCLARAVFTRLCAIEGPLEAACLYSSIAGRAPVPINPAKDRARAAAEAVFAANDREGA